MCRRTLWILQPCAVKPTVLCTGDYHSVYRRQHSYVSAPPPAVPQPQVRQSHRRWRGSRRRDGRTWAHSTQHLHIAHSTWTHSTQHLSTQHTAPGHIARCTYALSTQHLGTQHTAPKHKAYSTEHKAQRMDAVQWHPDRHSCVESKALVEFGCCMTQSAQHAADKGLSVSYWGRSRTGTLTVSR